VNVLFGNDVQPKIVAPDMFMGLHGADQMLILKEIAHFVLKLMQGILVVQDERNSNNEVELNLVPPMMSLQLVEMPLCDFVNSVLDSYRSQLAKFWPDEKTDFIKRHQHELLNAYKTVHGSKLLIDKQDHTTFFNMGWDDMKGCFEHLRTLCGGLDLPTQKTLSWILASGSSLPLIFCIHVRSGPIYWGGYLTCKKYFKVMVFYIQTCLIMLESPILHVRLKKITYNEYIGPYFFITRCFTIFASELPEILAF
jgi:hypothetical protein